MSFKKIFVVLLVLISSVLMLSNTTNVNADGFDDVKEIPATLPDNP